jgi:hypothetical protein
MGRIRDQSSRKPRAHIGAEISPLRHRILSGFVLGPAIGGRHSENIHIALLPIRLCGFAAAVIILDRAAQVVFSIGIAMNRDIERQAQTLLRLHGRPSDRKSRDRKHMLRELEQRRNGSCMISHRADRTRHQSLGFRGEHERAERDCGIDGSIEKRIQMIVRK